MKITIEIWQSKFNEDWYCDISSGEDEGKETQHWSCENFIDLLKMINKKIPNAQCITKERE
jgi:hypothetical protein